MTATMEGGVRTPWHLWLVAGLSLLWNGYGGYDFVMSHVGGDEYLHSMGMSDPQIAHMRALPPWMGVDWAVGVWGAVVGSILLLLRSRFAFHAFVASLAGLLISIAYYHLSAWGKLLGPPVAVSIVLVTAGVLFIVYAQAMAKRGVLR